MAQVLIGNVKGPQGDTGATGPQGPAGTPGVTDYATTSAAGLVRVGNDVKVNSSNGTLSLNTDSITEPSTLTTLANGDSLATILGKVKSAISKVITIFSDYLKSSNIVNNFTTTAAGYTLDARAGKTLNDSLANKVKGVLVTAGASKTFTVASTTRAAFFSITGVVASAGTVGVIYTAGSGALAMHKTLLGDTEPLTYSTSNNTLTVTNSNAGAVYIGWLVFEGTVSW